MTKPIAIAICVVLALVAVPFSVSAKPQHPDGAVKVIMERLGADVTSKITVENVGAATAHNVRVDANLPGSGWSFAAPECSASGSAITCRLPELAKGKAWTLTATKRSAPCESMSASAQATTPSDKQSRNDKASASTPNACGIADLVLRKIGHRDLTGIRFTIIVTNDGPRASKNVVLVDELPTHPSFRWRLDGGDSRACTIQNDRMECRWSELQDDSRKVVQVYTTATLCAAAHNTAFVRSADDPNELNNVASAYVPSLCPL